MNGREEERSHFCTFWGAKRGGGYSVCGFFLGGFVLFFLIFNGVRRRWRTLEYFVLLFYFSFPFLLLLFQCMYSMYDSFF